MTDNAKQQDRPHSHSAQVKELVEEINRDAWSDDKARMRVIARTSDRLLKLLDEQSGPSERIGWREEWLI